MIELLVATAIVALASAIGFFVGLGTGFHRVQAALIDMGWSRADLDRLGDRVKAHR